MDSPFAKLLASTCKTENGTPITQHVQAGAGAGDSRYIKQDILRKKMYWILKCATTAHKKQKLEMARHTEESWLLNHQSGDATWGCQVELLRKDDVLLKHVIHIFKSACTRTMLELAVTSASWQLKQELSLCQWRRKVVTCSRGLFGLWPVFLS